jgi:hypothetical protein
MADTIFQFEAPEGLTLTLDLFPEGSDTATASAKASTEETNREGVYLCTVSEAATGNVLGIIKSAGATIGHVRYVDVADDTSTYLESGRANVTSISGDSTAADNLESACDNYSATRGLTGTALPAAAADAAGGVPISDAGELDLDAMDTNVATVVADLPQKVTKNVALTNFAFKMVDATDLKTAEPGLTPTCTRSIDGAAFGACANAAAEISNGWYKIDLDAADLNGDVIILRFTDATSADREVVIVTQATLWILIA